MKHTKGKWTIRPNATGTKKRLEVLSEYRKSKDHLNIICHLEDDSYNEETYSQGETEQLANAKLIASSPELLIACELAMGMLNHIECVQKCDGKGYTPGGEQCQWCDEKNKIQQAIKKAI